MTYTKKFSFRTKNLFVKMLLYFLTLLVPIVLIGFISYTYSLNNIKKDFTNMITMHLKSSIKTVDIYIHTSQEINLNLLYDESVRKRIAAPNSMSTAQKIEFDSVLNTISRNQNVVNYYIDSLFIFQDNKVVFTSEGIDDYTTFFEKLCRFEKYDPAFWFENLKKIKDIEILPPSNIYKYNGTVSNVIPIITVNKMNNVNTAMVVCLDTDTIYRTVKNNSPFNSSNYMILDSNNHYIVGSYDQNKDDKTIEMVINKFKDNENSAREIFIDNRKMVVTSQRSESFGWKYYALTPINEFDTYARDILMIIIISSILLIIIGISLSLLFSFKLYNPIKNIRDMLLQNKDAESGSDVLEAIKNGISSLVDTSTDNLSKYQKASQGYLDNSFSQLIFGHRIENKELFEWMLLDVVKFKGQYYLCFNILFTFKDSFYSEKEDEKSVLLNSMKRVICTLIEEKCNVYVLDFDYNLYVCIINSENPIEKDILQEIANSIFNYFEQYLDNYDNIAIGLGSSVNEINNISKSHSDAMSAIGIRKPGSRFQILDSETIPINYNINYSFSDEIKLLNCLKTGDSANLKKVLESIIQKNRNNTLSYKNMNVLFEQFYNTGIRFVSEAGYDIDSISGYEEGYRFNSDSSISIDFDTKLKELESFFERIMNLSASKNDKRTNTLITMITDYIEKNYDKDIYLEKIAAEMGTSSKYISRTFKSKTGVNLTDFISFTRIKKAKELLINTNLNIDEICKHVGINNRFTFLRVFKKFEGTSPSSFRNTLQL
ncbi:MAG: transcriptional regulator, AraC family [Clostridiales bacterium]|nr:transcriptional regulator, AraC family [Clostridiales bacterium]